MVMVKWFSPFLDVMIVFLLLAVLGISSGLGLIVVPVEVSLTICSWSAISGYIVGVFCCLGFWLLDVS